MTFILEDAGLRRIDVEEVEGLPDPDEVAAAGRRHVYLCVDGFFQTPTDLATRRFALNLFRWRTYLFRMRLMWRST